MVNRFTEEEKRYLKEFIQKNSNPKTKLRQLLDKLKDDETTGRTEWHKSIETKYNQWLEEDKRLEEEINQNVYPYKKLVHSRNILKKFMLDK